MGYANVEQVVAAAKEMSWRDAGTPVRTLGLWHVLMFLRHRALHGLAEHYTFDSYDLAEAAFDINGVTLPTSRRDRNIYYEPGPTMGDDFFRNADAPRNTYLNRIYTGLTGIGVKQPKLFTASKGNLPTEIALHESWLDVLRDNESNAFVLDRPESFVTWLFRFGVPVNNGATTSITVGQGQPVLRLRDDVKLEPIAGTVAEIKDQLAMFLGLTSSELDQLIPSLDKVDPGTWQVSSAISMSELGDGMASLRATAPSSGAVGATVDQLPAQLTDVVAAFAASARDAGLLFDRSLVARFIASLISRRFVILTGLSGSGKTKLAQAFAKWLSVTDYRSYSVVPVGADWIGNENVVGYPDGLSPPIYGDDGSVTSLGRYVTRPTLDLLLQASARPETPHFLILDEMNLSHVERYFSDFLSMIESGESMTLYVDKHDTAGIAHTRDVPPSVNFPSNLFIIGTVNVDETTYMFSPKVLDRAQVIEFRVSTEEMTEYLSRPASVDAESLLGLGAAYGPPLVRAAEMLSPEAPEGCATRLEAEILLFFRLLQEHGFEFGFRTANDAVALVNALMVLSNSKAWDAKLGRWEEHDGAGRDWLDAALDVVILQKFLPKLHGSKMKLTPMLKTLYACCVAAPGARDVETELARLQTEAPLELLADANGARYPLSAAKLARMHRQANLNGFVSFIDA